jgi:CMP/dCMP kinase
MAKLTIAIDGPAGSGKSTVARRVAALLGYLYLDSGAMYRAVALKALERDIPLQDETQLETLTRETHIELKPPTINQEVSGLNNRVFLDGREVTHEIRTSAVAQAASRLATVAGVRSVLVNEQQRAGQGGGVVMEGRDIGTKVFPDADLKIFLDADPVVREERRMQQQKIKGEVAANVAADLRERDHRDRTRAVSPLVAAEDAVIIDSTNLGEDDVLARVEGLAKNKRGNSQESA